MGTPTGRVGAQRLSRGAMLVLLALAVVMSALIEQFDAGWAPVARERLFDVYQRIAPRESTRLRAVVLAIDETTLAYYGPWPWPRSRLAELLDAFAQAKPSAVGFDMLFTAPDVNDPQRVLASQATAVDQALRQQLSKVVGEARLEAAVDASVAALGSMESTDDHFEFALFAAPVVLARRAALDDELAALAARDGTNQPPADPMAVVVEGPDPRRFLATFSGSSTNLRRFEAQARGIGFISATNADADGVIRSVPLVANVAGRIVPTLPVEMLRVAQSAGGKGEAEVTIETDNNGVVAVRIGALRVETNPRAELRLRFGKAGATRLADMTSPVETIELRAARVLGAPGQEPFVPKPFENTLALVGIVDVGGVDAVATPMNPSAAGVFIHAEAIENILDGGGLVRPGWVVFLEIALASMGILIIGILAPRTPAAAVVVLVLGVTVTVVGVSFSLFVLAQTLLAPALPVLAVLLATITVRTAMFAASRREARELSAALHVEQVERARVAGELDAAREIQLGLLPDTSALPGLPANIEVSAVLEPAREVGGDLYDAFMLDERRLFFVVGDVAGKGIPASLFMAVGKTLSKSSALRESTSLGDLVTRANAEISRDNPAQMFITALFGILDTESGELRICNAGHDHPILVDAVGSIRILKTAGGPPLCMLDDFEYDDESDSLGAGERLVLTTDGVGEAHNTAKELFGHERLEQLLDGATRASAAQTVSDVRHAVESFRGAEEPYDDLTVMVIARL
jgi:adenylate cyclase